MKKLRELKLLVRSICYLLILSLAFMSCQNESISIPQDGCGNSLLLNDLNKDEIEYDFELMLDYAWSLDNQEDFTIVDEYIEEVFGQSDQVSESLTVLKSEQENYSVLGFDSYIENQNFTSSNFKNYLANYKGNLSVFLEGQNPTLSEFSTFISSSIDELSSSSLCNNDKNLMKFYLYASQGYANWFYKHYYVSEIGGFQSRACESFGSVLKCGLLALVVGVVVGSSVGIISSIATITGPNGTFGPGEHDDFDLVAGIAVGLYAGINVYKWCCSLNEIEEQVCIEPTGYSYIQTNCNEYEIRFFGPSNYGDTQWKNNNTEPDNIITPTPKLRFTIPVIGDPSDIVSDITCLESGAELMIFPQAETITFESDTDVFPLSWGLQPPYEFFYGHPNFFDASVSTASTSDYLTYTWSVNPPNLVLGANGNEVNIRVVQQSGIVTTSVLVQNTCLNTSESLSAQTLVQ